jgi:VWFA-related protein
VSGSVGSGESGRPMDHRVSVTVRVGVLGGGLLVAAAAAAQQEPPPAFPSQAEVVTVDVVVTGKDGAPVLGLRAADFNVTEDDVPQEIAAFEAVDRPLPTPSPASSGGAAPPPASPGPRSSSNLPPAGRQGSAFVIVFDELHLAPPEAERARTAIRDFLATGVAPGDQVALVGTGEGARWTARMPWGLEMLRGGLERLRGRLANRTVRDRMTGWEAMRIARFDDPIVTDTVTRRFLETGEMHRATKNPGPGERPDREAEREDLADRRSRVQALAASVYARASMLNEQTLSVVERELVSLAGAHGRKTLVFVSGGLVADPGLAGAQRVVREARRANAAVYFLDARGLVAVPFALDAENPGAPSRDLDSTLPRELDERSEGSEGLASDTGGFSVKNTNDLADGLARIGREARRYYLLGYTPTNRRADGRFRRIRVSVAREGVTVRARRGYFAPGGEGDAVSRTERRDEAMLEALYAPLDRDEVPLRAIADVFDDAGPGKATVQVTVEADIRALAFEDEGETARDTLEFLLLVAPRGAGEPVRLDQQFQMKLSPQTRDCYERSWFPISRKVELAPGLYEARIVARDGNSGRVGSVTHDFEVPGRQGLRLSSLVLGDRVREGTEDGARVLEATARRRFAPRGPLRCRFEVYGATPDPGTGSPNVTAGFSVRRSDGTFLLAAPETHLPADPNGALARSLELPLAGAPPGSYELIVVITDRVAGRAAEAREPFVIADAGTLPPADVLALSCGADARGLSARYWAVVDLYARGNVSGAIERLGRLPDAGVREELARLRELAERASRCTRCPEVEALGAKPVAEAAMLHTDAAWWAPEDSPRRPRELGRARELVDVLRPLPGGTAFARRWFLASTLHGHQRMDWRAADEVATEGERRFPEDPELLLAHGTLLETVGWRTAADGKAAKPYLERAEAALARAEELSPSEETALRLAHVRWRLGRTSAARADLERLTSAVGDGPWRYLAFLFLGGVLEEEGQLPGAAQAYRRSLETQPHAQTVRMALAHCLVKLGRVADARAGVAAALALARVRDPFWAYPWGRSGEADEILAGLRMEALRCCR